MIGGHTETDSDTSRHASVPASSSAAAAGSSKTPAAMMLSSPSTSDLVRELLFVFQGIQGSLIKYTDGRYDLSRKVTIPTHQKNTVLKLCEVGWLYR